MRHCLLFASVSIVSLVAGMTLDPVGGWRSCLVQPQLEQPCAAQDGEPGSVASIDDRKIKQQIERAGGAMADEGTATKAAVLIEQLSVGSCELALPHVALKPQEDGLLYEQAKHGVVVVSGVFKCGRCNNWHARCASGFVMSSSGAIATSYHVIDNPDTAVVVARTANGQVLPVQRVLAASKADDIVIVEVDVQDHALTPLPVAKSRTPIGASVSVISHPSQRFYSYTSGVVSRYTRVRSNDGPAEAMAITADFARGSSGAPVLNDQGEVVGIVRSTESIYYKVENGQQHNLQMVFKTCVPAANLLELVAAKAN